MPNHVRTAVNFKNLKKKDIDIILQMIATETESSCILDFDKVIPEPRTIEECPADCIVTEDSHITVDEERPWFDWYNWHVTHWGTKWRAFDGYTIVGKSHLLFVFSTAWSCAYPVIERLSLLGYDIDVKYADEDIGYNCGKMTYKNASGWTHWCDDELKNPRAFAERVWENY